MCCPAAPSIRITRLVCAPLASINGPISFAVDFRKACSVNSSMMRHTDRHKPSRKRSQKKTMSQPLDPRATPEACPFGVDLCVDSIMAFLDNRKVLCFATCHRRFATIVSYEHVLTAARATESQDVRSIMEKIKKQAVDKSQIFMPSPIRLLKLTCGVRICELCRSPDKHVSTVTCGLFLCSECICTLLARQDDDPPRVRMCAEFVDANGECAGPFAVSHPLATADGVDTKQGERCVRQAHEKRIGWTADRHREFCQIYDAMIQTWPREDKDSVGSFVISLYGDSDDSLSHVDSLEWYYSWELGLSENET